MKKLLLLTLVIALFLLSACGRHLSEEEQAYIRHYDSNREWTLAAVNNLLDLIAVWSPEDETWWKDAISQIALIRVCYHHAQEMNPPDSMAQIHVKYLRAMSDLDSVYDPIITAIAHEYETVPSQVIISLDIGMQHLAETQALIDNL